VTSAVSEPAKPISKADVEAILAKLADEQDEDYDWKRSIVDLMKLLKLDSAASAPERNWRRNSAILALLMARRK
jgi:hypothetical protein